MADVGGAGGISNNIFSKPVDQLSDIETSLCDTLRNATKTDVGGMKDSGNTSYLSGADESID